jgi:long-chain acyl-CoA synthetase
VQNPAIIRLIGEEVEKANQEIARVEQVKKFRLIPKLLDPSVDGEPVTPTRKIKRELMYQQFKDIVESMYSDKEEKLVAMEIGDVFAR